MKIGIVGYDLFGPGGTSRSNINLINEFLEINKEVVYFNLLPFTKKKLKQISNEIIDMTKIKFFTVDKFGVAPFCEVFIITRESMFSFSKIIKTKFPEAKIIGEVHAPLDLIDDEIDLCPEVIDTYRVATQSIKEKFYKKISDNNVVVFPVSARHITTFNDKYNKVENRINFLIYSRFDERQKDIAYAIKLIDYLVHTMKQQNIYLYINGRGPGEGLYKKLISFYSLEKNVFINKEKPETCIYLSTARYETFGYSIMESFSEGNQIVLYQGDDHSLKDIYNGFQSICWLKKDISEDAQAIVRFLLIDNRQAQDAYTHDIQRAKEMIIDNYGERYITTVIDFSIDSKKYTAEIDQKTIYAKLLKDNNLRSGNKLLSVYMKVKEFPIIGKVIGNKHVKDTLKKVLSIATGKKNTSGVEKCLEGHLYEHYVFVESFHGKSFSGDPKYLALDIKKRNPETKIYVSSTNDLVDMEILDNGCIPVRLGGIQYIDKFRRSKLAIINGNSLDKVGKVKGQIFLQTWHGFPLKKMVANLEDKEQREEETEAFIPRMKKWDYLLSSSLKNTELFQKAFLLEQNKNLKVIECGVPRNAYLINNKNNLEEKKRVIQKYFNRIEQQGKKFILYCPTWRKDKRDKVSNLDLKQFINLLPLEYDLIVKLHPLESDLVDYYRQIDSRIHCFPNEITDIQELFLISDVLITDYSSAMFDYAHLDKKIIVLQEDMEEYSNNIGWYFDLKKVTGLKGRRYTEAELVMEIQHKDEKNYNKKILEYLLTADNSETGNKVLKQIRIGWNIL